MRWRDVHGDELASLVFFACLKYGATQDASRIRSLHTLYQRFVGETTVQQRNLLYLRLDNAVNEGLGSADTFLPLIYTEPSIGLVSSASMSFVQFHPLKDGDLLTGPKTLRAMIDAVRTFPNPFESLELLRCRQEFDRPLPPLSARKVGMLQGLLLLGDRRVLPLLDGCWRTLADAEQNALTKAYSGLVYASVIDFLLSWLAEASDYIVGAVAAALGRMPLNAVHPRVVDVERCFPANGPNKGKHPRRLGEWTFPEYLPRIEPHLRILLEREDGREMYDTITQVWEVAR